MTIKASGSRHSILNGVKNVPTCEEMTLLNLAKFGGLLGNQACSRLVQSHYGWILDRCKSILGHCSDADDAAQEAALRMFKALPKFEGRSSLRTWLNTIVHNECMTLIRRRQRSILSAHLESLLEIHQKQYTESRAVPLNCNKEVHITLNQMPAKSREVIQLRFFNELSLEDISRTLGISLSATKMRLYRALQSFSQLYTHEELSFS